MRNLGTKRVCLDNHNVLYRPIQLTSFNTSKLVHHIHPISNPTKNGMFAVQMRRRSQRNKELTAVCSGTAIRHGESSLRGVGERAVKLVFELLAVDGFSSSAGTCWITPLDHEAGNDAMENDIVVFACVCKLGKVSAGQNGHQPDSQLEMEGAHLTFGVLSEYSSMVMSPKLVVNTTP
jgi:hypothetical protein